MQSPKHKPLRSESYRRYVASKPCFGCDVSGYSQCAHGNGGGMGTKVSDLESFPLCCTRPGVLGCHAEFDQCIGMTKHERRDLTEQYVKRMQAMAREDGRPELT